jgi:hypothetical protein
VNATRQYKGFITSLDSDINDAVTQQQLMIVRDDITAKSLVLQL